jgi:hypothetical protein
MKDWVKVKEEIINCRDRINELSELILFYLSSPSIDDKAEINERVDAYQKERKALKNRVRELSCITVGELIEYLQTIPENSRVIVNTDTDNPRRFWHYFYPEVINGVVMFELD